MDNFDKVDAWLEAHDEWAMATDERCGLAYTWYYLRKAMVWEERRAAPTTPFVVAGYRKALAGVLLALVREAWEDPGIFVAYRCGLPVSMPAWLIKTETSPEHYGSGHWTGHTEIDALVTALKARMPNASP